MKGFEYFRHFNTVGTRCGCGCDEIFYSNKIINTNSYYPDEYGQATIGIFIYGDDIYVGIARLSTEDKDYVKKIGIKVMRTKYIPLMEYISTQDKYQKVVLDILVEALKAYSRKRNK